MADPKSTPRPADNILLAPSPVKEDEGALAGRDPRSISKEDWLAATDQDYRVGMKAIRAKCLDCAYSQSEVLRCVQTNCPLWPLRMGKQPKGFKAAREHLDAKGALAENTETNDSAANDSDEDERE